MSLTRTSPRPATVALHVAAVAVVLAGLLVATNLLTGGAPSFEESCLEGEPYLVAAAYRGQAARNRPPDLRAPSVILFQDTPNDDPFYTLASFRDIGTVWGLAYRRSEPAVYAATYHKRAMPFGPEGPGAIYRIDLATGEASHFATVPNAGDRQRGSPMSRGERYFDRARARDVGEVSLGDMDISSDESQLFVVNLYDTKIYRIALPSGDVLDSFEHGASNESWQRDARPFGLAFHDDHLYHGVVNSKGTGSEFVARIYRSGPDGSNMAPVANLELNYRRDGIRLRTVSGAAVGWKPWSNNTGPSREEHGHPKRIELHAPQPMLTDLAFTGDGQMVIGLRDRFWDIELQWINEDETLGPTTVSFHQPTPTPIPSRVTMAEQGIGFGDILLGEPDGDGWVIGTDPEHFDDTNALGHAESALGGLAWIPDTTTVAASTYGVRDARSELIIGEEGVTWFDVATGSRTAFEAIGRPGRAKPYERLLDEQRLAHAHTTTEIFQDYEYLRDLGTLGDVEVLCAPAVDPPTPTPTPTGEMPPTPTPTDTPVLPSPTAVPPTDTPTPTVVTATPTATPTPIPLPIYLPISLREHCDPEYKRADVALVIDTSSSMDGAKLADAKAAALAFATLMDLTPGRDQVAVVRYDTEAEVAQQLTSGIALVEQAIGDLRNRRGTHIDRGLLAALGELQSERRIEANLPVMVLLTDGIQTGDAGAEIAAAAAVRDAGVVLYTIGLGVDVDSDTLKTMAGADDRYYFAPDSARLAEIYGEIASDILCQPEQFWGNR